MDIPLGQIVQFKVCGHMRQGVLIGYTPKGSYKIRMVSGKEVIQKNIQIVGRLKTKHGLLDIAIEILRVRNTPLTTLELVTIIQEGKMWEPCRQGKTPRLTLYSMLYNEAFYKDLPRVGKDRKGGWFYINYFNRHRDNQ